MIQRRRHGDLSGGLLTGVVLFVSRERNSPSGHVGNSMNNRRLVTPIARKVFRAFCLTGSRFFDSLLDASLTGHKMLVKEAGGS